MRENGERIQMSNTDLQLNNWPHKLTFKVFQTTWTSLTASTGVITN